MSGPAIRPTWNQLDTVAGRLDREDTVGVLHIVATTVEAERCTGKTAQVQRPGDRTIILLQVQLEVIDVVIDADFIGGRVGRLAALDPVAAPVEGAIVLRITLEVEFITEAAAGTTTAATATATTAAVRAGTAGPFDRAPHDGLAVGGQQVDIEASRPPTAAARGARRRGCHR